MGEKLDVEDIKRHKTAYRGEHLYVSVSPLKVHLSIANIDEFRTLAGIQLIERMINELIDRGATLEEIANFCFESSYHSGDIPEILSKALVA